MTSGMGRSKRKHTPYIIDGIMAIHSREYFGSDDVAFLRDFEQYCVERGVFRKYSETHIDRLTLTASNYLFRICAQRKLKIRSNEYRYENKTLGVFPL